MIFVRSHTGLGEFADFDPRTGGLRGSVLALGPLGGVYGEVGDVPMVFYRDGSRLALRAGGQVVDLDGPAVGADWQRVDGRTARFVLNVSGSVVCDVRYRSVTPDLDLGLLIRDVLADPDRRTRIFSH